MSPTVEFEPIGRRGEYKSGENLLEISRSLGIDLVNICGGEGSCGGCVVQVLEGELSPVLAPEMDFLSDEQFAQGYRLACCAIPTGACKVRIPPESMTTPQRTQVEGQEIPTPAEPVVQSYLLELDPPTIQDLRSDSERVLHRLASEHQRTGSLHIDYALCQQLSPLLRSHNWRTKAILRGDEVIALLSPDSKLLGVAVDLGTTKIAAYLMDLESGQTLASRGFMNPQIAYGEDIITRMAISMENPQKASQLQNLVIDALNKEIQAMCTESGQAADQIVEIVVVGNTAMHHLFLGLPVKQLGLAPYVPAVSESLNIKGHELKIKCAPGAYVHLLPNIAGYVGADHVAMLLGIEMLGAKGLVLAIDIGTNTEICLSDHGQLMSLSTASGPAFEGAHIKHGMRAAQGAIERLRLVEGKVEYKTIGDAPAVGLCGSGILDVLAQLCQAGIVSRRGRLGEHPLVRGTTNQREFVIAGDRKTESLKGDLTFTQKDIQEIQLAKAAIRTGINVLLRANQHQIEELDQIILAGAFGTYLDITSAMRIGMLPNIPVERVRQVGNAAGMGARMALISKSRREEAALIADQVRYVELAADKGFSSIYANALYLE